MVFSMINFDLKNVSAWESNDYGYLLISGYTTGGGKNNNKPIAGGLSRDDLPDVKSICLYMGETFTDDNGTYRRYYILSNLTGNTYNWHLGVAPGRFAVSYMDMYTVNNSYIYIFSDKSAAQKYLEDGDASGAENYDDILIDDGDYDVNIPTADKVYVSGQSASKLNYNVEFSQSSYDYNGVSYPLYYESEVRHYYTLMFDKDYVAKRFTPSSLLDSNRFIDCQDLMSGYKNFTKYSVIGATVTDSQNAYSLLCAGNVYIAPGLTYKNKDSSVSVGTDYNVLDIRNFYDELPCNKVMGNSCGVRYIASQIRIQSYIVLDDGSKLYGNAHICTKFLFDSHSKDSVVNPVDPDKPKDDDNDDGSEDLDDDGEVTIPDNPTDDIDLSDLPGLIRSVGGFFTALKPFLAGVPSSIWSLLGLALTIAIVCAILRYSH